MTNFRYVDFYDVPRTIVVRFQNRWFLLQSAFNDELDEYEKEYSIYPLPDSFEPVQSGSPWKFLEELELNCIAKVPVNSVQFDRTKRKKLKTSVLLQALQLEDSRQALRDSKML